MDEYLGEEKFEKFVKWKYSRNVELRGELSIEFLQIETDPRLIIFAARGKIRWSCYLSSRAEN